ncbi:MAG: ATP-binding cassette domain-containing protein [Nitrososphaeria archaeon]|nr:ATP-binding cassette domain-containing protein [Nitrososphaeria archaeon]
MEKAVDVRDVVKIFNKNFRALDGVSLEIESGSIFALLGPNGAGKTTLMRILTTQIGPSSGHAYVFGLDTVKEGSQVRKLISYVPQEMSVWTDISGYENLLIYSKIYGIPKEERNNIINGVLESMGLHDVSNRLVKTYSGGMIRRLEIACALLVRPKILFLDEPTIGLDPSARKVVWEKLKMFKKDYGTTIFFNTHYMDEAEIYSDLIAIINRGKIVTIGTSEELKHSVGGEILHFILSENGLHEDVLRELEGIEGIKDVVVSNSDVTFVVNDAEMILPHIMTFFNKKNIFVRRVSITKPTLDDVFLKYAGTRIDVSGRLSEVTHVRRMIRRG